MTKRIPENNVLVIDDEPMVRRMMVRKLAPIVNAVFTASNIGEAISILNHNRISKLICDFNLGENHPTGDEVVGRLRRLHPGIQHAAIFTGSDVDDVPVTDHIDRVFDKGAELFLILAWVKQ